MDTFEKFTFPDPNTPRSDYYSAAPGARSRKYDINLKGDDIINDPVTTEGEDLDDLFLHDIYEPLVDRGQVLLSMRNLNQTYKQGAKELHILKNVDLRLYSGEITALVGPSGSGKSTLLHILGLLDTPTSGQMMIGEQNVSNLSDRRRTKLRSEHIGFIYQFHHLLPEFSALENVALPQIIAGFTPAEAYDKAASLLEQLGLEERLKHRPATLSGGEQQRVAIARALINDPILLFADEPTGNLDPDTAERVFEMLLELVRKRGIGALIATHNIHLAQSMDRILEVKSGRILPY